MKNTCGKVDLLVQKYRVIGIWGMGGIGKSTIAKALFAKYFPSFDHVCFVANAKEFSLDKLFSNLFREEVSASNVVGSTFDMRRLRRKKILIVLDDMDRLDVLEYLCREYEDLDPASKLIITTRDKQLLEGRVDQIYEVKKWKTRPSLKLFCFEAFKQKHPKKGYEILSESAVEYAGGVPLALKVLGSYLRSKGRMHKLKWLNLEGLNLKHILGELSCLTSLKVLKISEMLGMTKRITFKNSGKLDGHSLRIIMNSLHLTMMSAAYHNVLVRSYGTYKICNYTSVELCLPGGTVPEHIHYRSTKSSITIALPSRSELLGFIYSVVLSPIGGMKTDGAKIFCKCHLPEEGIKATWLYGDIRGLKSDHLYVWYDPLHCDNILRYYELSKVCFEFCVANDKGEVDGSICIKECGVGIINVLEVHSVLQELDFDSDKKKKLVEGVELESKLGNQQRVWSESSSSDTSESDSEIIVKPDSAEKGKSTHKETKTDSRTNALKYGSNKEAPVKSDATLHESVGSHLDNENEFREKSITQSKVVVMVELENTESTCKETLSTAKRSPKENSRESTEIVANEHFTPLQASSQGSSEHLHDRLDKSNKQVVETHDTDKFVTEYSSFDLENCLQQLDENPFAILDLLSNEPSPSLKQSETCVQKVAQANDATTILNEFRTLVFSTSLLKKLPDQSYRQQIEESLHKLNTYRREITEEQNEGLETFIELYNKASKISQDKMLTEDEEAKLASEKRDLYNKLQDSKLKVQQFDTTISTSKYEIENLQKRQREIQEAIKKLQQEKEALEKERSTLEFLCSEKQTKKNETLESVKHISTSVVYTTKQLKELVEKRLSLVSAYEDLKKPYQRMKTKPPF
ncbi:hypothetical protein ACSQ67_021612 [Phaseolus vulgaris]